MALARSRGVDDVLDFVARARRLDERQPVLARQMAGLRQDLDHVAVAQRVLQRHDAAVHLGADAGVADVGVDGVGEIDGRRVARQHDHLAPRREGVNFFRVQVHFERGHELARIAHVAAAIRPAGAARRCADRPPPAPLRPSLYFQCAAMPSSAMRCISSVRICTSKCRPSGPITEVCSD